MNSILRAAIASGCLLLSWLPCCSAQSDDTVRASIGKDNAWTGEPVPLIITLYAPGPFSGTASFDLPELPQTVILKADNPVVGSEEIDGVSYLTQRHEFRLYTQQTGEFVLPPFQVHFSAKETFTSDPVPREGKTEELRFRSNRPDSAAGGVVIAATKMSVKQAWFPESFESLEAGDVIQRSVTRQASGTTAMMLSPVLAEAPAGVRVYETDPIVNDQTERGESTANRVDTIKYQFQHPGSFELPAIEFVWWDTQSEELKHDSLPGISVNIAGPVLAESVESIPPTTTRTKWIVFAGIVIAVVFGSICYRPLKRCIIGWQEKRRSSEVVAAKRVESACRANDASAAYSAVLDWNRVADNLLKNTTVSTMAEFKRESALLSSSLFGSETDAANWNGTRLLASFQATRRSLRRNTPKEKSTSSSLPQLNPRLPGV